MSTARFFYQDPLAPQPDLPYQIGALAIIEKDDTILLEQRSDGGQWSLIGGGMEQDESVVQCLIREVKEETGLEVIDWALFGVFSEPSRIMQFPDGHVARGIGMVFRVKVKEDTHLICSHESLRLEWIPKNKLQELDIIALQKKVFDCYLHGETGPVVD